MLSKEYVVYAHKSELKTCQGLFTVRPGQDGLYANSQMVVQRVKRPDPATVIGESAMGAQLQAAKVNLSEEGEIFRPIDE